MIQCRYEVPKLATSLREDGQSLFVVLAGLEMKGALICVYLYDHIYYKFAIVRLETLIREGCINLRLII